MRTLDQILADLVAYKEAAEKEQKALPSENFSEWHIDEWNRLRELNGLLVPAIWLLMQAQDHATQTDPATYADMTTSFSL